MRHIAPVLLALACLLVDIPNSSRAQMVAEEPAGAVQTPPLAAAGAGANVSTNAFPPGAHDFLSDFSRRKWAPYHDE